MRTTSNMTIHVLRSYNPFRPGSQGRRIFGAYTDGMTVAAFYEATQAIGFDRARSQNHLNFDIRNSNIELRLRGVTVPRELRPRQPRRARAATTPAIYSPREGTAPGYTPAFAQVPYAETFGAEIECLLPASMSHAVIASRITAAGVACRQEVPGQIHAPREYWKAVTDGSLHNYQRGVEIVTPSLPPLSGDAGMQQLTTVCRVLTEAGAKITKDCGLHVHIGARHLPVEFFRRLVRLYTEHETILDSIQPESRRRNNYATPVRINHAALARATTIDEVVLAVGQSVGRENARNHNRYRKINLQSFYQHGTVEFRQHSGTHDAKKACNWVQLCLRMAAWARSDAPPPPAGATLDEFLTAVGCTADERAWPRGRAASIAERIAARSRGSMSFQQVARP